MSAVANRNADKLSDAIACHQAGDLPTALRAYSEILASDPGNADAWHLSGLASNALGDFANGEQLIRRAIELKPTENVYQSNLAAVLLKQKRHEEAETLCRRVLRRDGRHASATNLLGSVLRRQGRFHESLDAYLNAVSIDASARSLCNLSTALIDVGRIQEAHSALMQARNLAPDKPQVHLNLGTVYRMLRRFPEAAESLQQAEYLDPNCAELHVNKGNLFQETGQVVEAIASFQKAIAIDSSLPSAVSGLGRSLQQIGLWKEALEANLLAKDLDPTSPQFYSSYLYSTTLSPLLSIEQVVQEHIAWGRQTEADTPVCELSVDATENRILRIGYVSPDIRHHATMRFLMPLLEAHDRSVFRIYCYSETSMEDSVTESVKQIVDGWCSTRGLTDDQLASQIQQDKIDILVDLAGHTADNRLPVFARKPAPVQASFLGYPTTTGLNRIDYFLTDAVREPPPAKQFFSETPVFMPHGAACYRASDSPDIVPPPCLQNGYITFGATHRVEKLSPRTLQVWELVMAMLPTSRLLIFRDVLKSESLRDSLRQQLTDVGINTKRVTFEWEMPTPYLQVYSKFDIMLDVFPWGSGTIAYDAMIMGVPIPTIAGDRGGCRTTASLMHHCGFPELATDSVDGYLAIVRQLARNPARLVELRNSIRPAMESTVCNGSQFAHDIEDAYRHMWRAYLGTELSTQREEPS